ncbi:MAG: pyridine nucleotide-disulfide oxidoreductase, partial [Thermoprotei archaeon]
MKVAIIGYGTAGMTTAGFIRIYGREREITVVEKRPYPIYHPCSIPDVIAGKIPSW